MKEFVRNLRDFVFVWGTFSAAVVWIGNSYDQYCQTCIEMYLPEVIAVGASLVSSMIIWATLVLKVSRHEHHVSDQMGEMKIHIIKSDVDRFYTHNKDKDHLSEDEIKYVLMLEEMMQKYKINSFTQRKIDKLIEKDK